jgi:hypothetical protein
MDDLTGFMSACPKRIRIFYNAPLRWKWNFFAQWFDATAALQCRNQRGRA